MSRVGALTPGKEAPAMSGRPLRETMEWMGIRDAAAATNAAAAPVLEPK